MYNKKLQLFFKEKGLKQYEIAEIMGYTPTMISRYLKGTDKINANFITKLVENFPDIDLQYLFTDEKTINMAQKPNEYYGFNKTIIEKDLKIIEEKIANVRKSLAQISNNKE
jgi:transcriptional regulator with XRE-family HTH domain